jgi:hypothetical protein
MKMSMLNHIGLAAFNLAFLFSYLSAENEDTKLLCLIGGTLAIGFFYLGSLIKENLKDIKDAN